MIYRTVSFPPRWCAIYRISSDEYKMLTKPFYFKAVLLPILNTFFRTNSHNIISPFLVEWMGVEPIWPLRSAALASHLPEHALTPYYINIIPYNLAFVKRFSKNICNYFSKSGFCCPLLTISVLNPRGVVSGASFRPCRSHSIPLDIYIIPQKWQFVKRFLKIFFKNFRVSTD